MLEEQLSARTIVGAKQVLRALSADQLACVYIAGDVDAFLSDKLRTACEAHGVEIRPAPSMKELGTACKIDVGAACAGIPKEI